MDRQFCDLCGRQAYFACSQCEYAIYCGQQHQAQHWRIHKEHCSAFKDYKLKNIEDQIQIQRKQLRSKYFDHFMHKMYDQCIRIAKQLTDLERNHIEGTRQILNELQYGISICLYVKSKTIVKKNIQALVILKTYLNQKMHFLEDQKDIFSIQEDKKKMDKKSKQLSSKKLSLISSLAHLSYIVKDSHTIKLFQIYTNHVSKIYGSESIEISNCYFMVGTYYFQHKQYHKSIACFLKSANLRGNRAGQCYYNLGIIFYLINKTKISIKMFLNAKNVMITEYGQSSTQLADIYHNLALVHQSNGNYNESIYNLQKAAVIYSKNKDSQSYKDVIKFIKRMEKQIQKILQKKNQNINRVGAIGDIKKLFNDKFRKGSREEQIPGVDLVEIRDKDICYLKLAQSFLKKLNPLELFYLSELQLDLQQCPSEFMAAVILGQSKFLRILGQNKVQDFRIDNISLFKQISIEKMHKNTNKNNEQQDKVQ